MNNQIQALSHNVEDEEQKEIFDGLLEIVNEYITIEDIIEHKEDNEYSEIKNNGDEIEFIKKIRKGKDIRNLRDLKRFIVKYKNIITKNIREKTNINIYEHDNIEEYLKKIHKLVGYRNKKLYQNIDTLDHNETNKKVDDIIELVKSKVLNKIGDINEDKVEKILQAFRGMEKINGEILNIKYVNSIFKIAEKTGYKFIDFYILMVNRETLLGEIDFETNIINFLLGDNITIENISKLQVNTIYYIGIHGLDSKYIHLNEYIHCIMYNSFDEGSLDLEKLDVIYNALDGKVITKLIKSRDDYRLFTSNLKQKYINKYSVKYAMQEGIDQKTLNIMSFMDKKEYIYLLKYVHFIEIYEQVGIEQFDILYKKVGKEKFGKMSQFITASNIFGCGKSSNAQIERRKLIVDYIISNGIEEKHFNTLYGIANIDIKKYYEKVGIDLIYEAQRITSTYLWSILEKIGHENLMNYNNKLFIIIRLFGKYGGGLDSFLELDFSNPKLVNLINNLDIYYKDYVVFQKFYKHYGNQVLLNDYLDGKLTKGIFKESEYTEEEFINRIYEFVGN